MYANEKKYVVPFMGATVGLFLSGVYFGYRWVLPNAIKVLVFDFGVKLGIVPILTIEDYTGFFMSVILGLGICFELPILIFFLALFGIVDAKFLAKNYRYAILAIFVVAAIICPMQDPLSMCLFASPMLALYIISIAIAYFVHPSRRNKPDTPAAA
jgi:sec-independent protein translocase protein TatC